jgi:hypothetical protein
LKTNIKRRRNMGTTRRLLFFTQLHGIDRKNGMSSTYPTTQIEVKAFSSTVYSNTQVSLK